MINYNFEYRFRKFQYRMVVYFGVAVLSLNSLFAEVRTIKPILSLGYSLSNANGDAILDTLFLSGANFVPTSKASLDNIELQTFFIDKFTLKVYIPPTLKNEGEYNIMVTNPPTGGGTSSSKKLRIVRPSANLIAAEMTYTFKETYYHALDTKGNQTPRDGDETHLSIMGMPLQQQHRVQNKIFSNGKCVVTISNITPKNSPGTKEYYTTMNMDAANRNAAVVVIDATTNPATSKFYFEDGSLMYSTTATIPSYQPILDKAKTYANPCPPSTPSGSTLRAAAAAAPLPRSSMSYFIDNARAEGATITDLGNERYKIDFSMPSNFYGLQLPAGRSAIMRVNAASSKNYVESVELYESGLLLNTTYYKPREYGVCIPEYNVIISESYYSTLNGTKMKNIRISELNYEQFQNNIFPR